MNRRKFLQATSMFPSLAAAGFVAGLPITPLQAAVNPRKNFVLVNIRGGWDVTNVTRIDGDAMRNMRSVRKSLAWGEREFIGVGNNLGFFRTGKVFADLYKSGELLLFPSVSSTKAAKYLGSHPSWQASFMAGRELKAEDRGGSKSENALGATGWLNRVAHHLAPNSFKLVNGNPKVNHIAVTGPAKTLSVANSSINVNLPKVSAQSNKADSSSNFYELMKWAYQTDTDLNAVYTRWLDSVNVLQNVKPQPTNNGGGGNVNVGISGSNAKKVGQILASNAGAQFGYVTPDRNAFDHHSDLKAKFPDQYASAGQAIADLKAGLGREWDNTVVFVVSEFGRSHQPESSKEHPTGTGTKHGKGQNAMVTGGAVKGGRVIGKFHNWSGNDVPTDLDMRHVFLSALQWMGFSANELNGVKGGMFQNISNNGVQGAISPGNLFKG